MIFGSVCSGIEAASVAWEPLGWRAAFLAEIDAFPCAVLAHRFPRVPNLGDFTTIGAGHAIDVLVGGTPCQSFSVAGLRGGLGDDRGNLALEFCRLADRLKPRWIVWENVPGVLSSNGGRDFGSILGALAEIGYGFAYRILDAQFFGVLQRRRRVFVVGYLGDWRRAAAVLFERESLRGHPAPRREAGQSIAPTLAARTRGGGGLGTDFDLDGGLISPAVTSKWAKGNGGPSGDECQNLVAHALRGEGFDASEDGTGRGTPLVAHAFDARQTNVLQYGDRTGPLDTDGHSIAVAFAENSRAELRLDGGDGQTVGALKVGGGKPGQSYPAAVTRHGVRRLTPRECERLQGFPDDWTLVPYRGKPSKDGPRYKAIGNTMAVPVMRWIGERIALVERVAREAA